MRAALADVPGARCSPTDASSCRSADDAEDAAARLERVFGLVSFSVARRVAAAAELEAIGAAAVAAAAGRSPRARPSRSRSKRAARQALPRPVDGHRAAGRRPRHRGDRPARRRAHPRAAIGVEVTTDRAFVYAGTRAAPGGLPVGASGRALLLLSGGIDSPVAGWLAAKRGLALDAVYFHSPPYIGEKSRDKVLTLGRTGPLAGARSVTVVPFTESRSACATPAPPSWRSSSTAA